ncbi:MAG: tetratricopeptide repeat protein [Planctomycetota bacterium]
MTEPPPINLSSSNRETPFVTLRWLVIPAILILTAIVFGGGLWHEFVNLDDTAYVTENNFVRAGLSREGIAWSVTTFLMGNWHPITWWSLMLDREMYGDWAGGFVLTNVIIHAASAVLLYLWLRSMTGAVWKSALVAVVFAIHPLRAESVAWISERKDVLSVFFGMVTLYAYARYARRPRPTLFLLVVVSYFLSLCSKQMLVTLPFVLLLLDFWPLGRLPFGKRELPEGSPDLPSVRSALLLIVEKLPLLALAICLSVVVVYAQQDTGALAGLSIYPWSQRLANVGTSYVSYIVMTFWPTNLGAYYPHPEHTLPITRVLACYALLIAITMGVIGCWKRAPYLAVGWFWYLGTLVPVIGIVQIGSQALADRYTYFPQVGLLMALVWGLCSLPIPEPQRTAILTGASVAAVTALVFMGWRQVGFWTDSGVLYERILAVTEGNYFAHNGLGSYWKSKGEKEKAKEQFLLALEIVPGYPEAHVNLGLLFSEEKDEDRAMQHYLTALQNEPGMVQAHVNLGLIHYRAKRYEQAITEFDAALKTDPRRPQVYNNLAAALVGVGRLDEAAEAYRRALEFDPHNQEVRRGLAALFVEIGRLDDAKKEYEIILSQSPGSVEDRNNLGSILGKQQKFPEAIAQFQEVLKLDPNNASAKNHLGSVYWGLGRLPEAMQFFREAIKQNPKFADAANNLAWILATNANPQLRNGKEAVEFASQASDVVKKNPQYLDTLAAAHAEAGDFENAIKVATQAIEVARAENQPAVAKDIETRLALYRSGKPYHEPGGR